MAPETLSVVDDALFDLHLPSGSHPERPERLEAARAGLRASHVATRLEAPRDATLDELLRVHTRSYLTAFTGLDGRAGLLDADTYFAPRSVAAARRAAGGSIALVDSLMAGKAQTGFALLRPPGHHARPGTAMGFCLLNHVAVAAAHARANGAERVLILDWDVHHGNGTQEIFYEDPSVLYMSVHQFPFYPGTGDGTETGRGEGEGYTVNVPLSEGAAQPDYEEAFDRVVLPICDLYRPDLLLISAGFDAHHADPLASMRLDAATYPRLLAKLRSAVGEVTPSALILEGGYSLAALESCVASVARAAASRASAKDLPNPAITAGAGNHQPEIHDAKRVQSLYWRL